MIIQSRRRFIKNISYGAAGLLASPYLTGSRTYGLQAGPLGESSTVKLVTGQDRRGMAAEALAPFKERIIQAIAGKNIIIKPNFVVTNKVLAATHADTVRGVLDFLKTITEQKITIGECGLGSFAEAIKNYGYSDLGKEFNVDLVDLNTHSNTTIQGIVMKSGGTQGVGIIDDFLDTANYIISVCPMKTHDTVVATLSVKNILMGSPAQNKPYPNSEKVKMHGETASGPSTTKATTYNLFKLAHEFLPQLALVDGFQSMEGNGPAGGTAVDHRIMLAGFDPIAVDMVAVKLMNIDPKHMKYLEWMHWAGLGNYDYENITVDGPKADDFIREYKMHRGFDEIISALNGLKAPEIPGCTDSSAGNYNPHATINDNSCASSVNAPGNPHFYSLRGGSGAYSHPAVIRISLPEDGETRLSIFNIRGRRICELFSNYLRAGKYSIAWDGRDSYGAKVPQGAYMAHMQSGSRFFCDKVTIF